MRVIAGAIGVACCLLPAPLAASEPNAVADALAEPIVIGNWELSPRVELRVRGEYRRNPVDVGGDRYLRTALQSDELGLATPPLSARGGTVQDQWLASERVRLGLAVRYGDITGVVTLQDARVLGWLPGGAPDVPRPGEGIFEPYEGYIQVRDDHESPLVELRIGRQAVEWGEGRLLGDKDWLQRGGALDAVRLRFHFGDALTDLELLAAMIAMPGPLPPPYGDTEAVWGEGTGAQLYGIRNAWHLVPLLHLELAGLARIARDPLPPELVRGDTYTVDLRVFGDYRGVSYSVEGAYQLGRVAGVGANRDIAAFATAARVDWQTALPLALRFGAFGSYASGEDVSPPGGPAPGTGDLGRFDPILPDVHEHHGMMDLRAWSNAIDGGARVGLVPFRGFDAALQYTFAALAEPGDRWSTASLIPVGADPANASRILGHEIDVRLAYEPWRGVVFDGGYGLFVTGEGARAILSSAGRGSPDLLQFGYLQASLRAP